MKAMVLHRICNLKNNDTPLELTDMPDPEPADDEILVKVSTCGVCHTELDEIEGRTPPPHLPVILGHQVVGKVEALGKTVQMHKRGDRVGVAWIYYACGTCEYCLSGMENLCQRFKATGRDVHGGYAEYIVVREDFAYSIPEKFSDSEATPLLCAGAIGFRSLNLTGIQNRDTLGLTGFGASAHLVLKMVKHHFPDSRVFVFARSKNEQEFALDLGAVWAGGTMDSSPEPLNAIIDTTPAWTPVMEAMKNLKPGGRLVINAIRKEETDKNVLSGLDYPSHLWMEKEIKSVANVCRQDVSGFLNLAAEIPILPEIQEFPLADANRALLELKKRKIRGAKVLKIG